MEKYREHQRGVIVLTEQVSIVQARIIRELIADGRQSYAEIARKIGETRKFVEKNYNKMVESGVITGATIHINYKSFGYKAVAYTLISAESQQAEQITEYLTKMPEIYACYNRGIKGDLDAIVILKTLEQLNDFKDSIKRNFSIFEIKTAIWTDVKEMNQNLAIINNNSKNQEQTVNCQINIPRQSNHRMIIDEIDQKIADKLSENGRASMETISKEIGIPCDNAKRRYEKLKKNGILKVTIQVNPNKIGYQALAIFFTVISNANSSEIIEKISKIPDIISIMKTAGDYDLQIYAMIKDIRRFLSIQEELGKIQGITKMDSEILGLYDWEKWPSPRQYISTF
jgi:Lrp/AsnC family leucine-responsive transcriptional regulator